MKDGVTHLRSYGKIFIHPRCKNTLREARLWSYKVDRITKEVLPILVDKHNHAWDAVRYALDGYIQRSGNAAIWEKLGQAANQ